MSVKEFSLQPLPVLVLGETAEATELLCEILRSSLVCKGYSNPNEALQALEREAFSVVVCGLEAEAGVGFLHSCQILRPETQRVLLVKLSELLKVSHKINKAKISFLLTKDCEASDFRETLLNAELLNRKLRENFELRKLALTDALTGISNHRYFWERLDAEFSRAQRFARPLSVVMCDIDNFKQFNDTYGHLKGDEVLHHVAQTLETSRRSMDTVARYGGEEFGLILPEVTHAQAIEIAKRHFETVLLECGISTSFGVSSFPSHAKTSTELVDLADKALLVAKKMGKGQVVSAP